MTKIKCVRCDGGKPLYKLGEGYTMVDIGCKKVTCPMCSGEGKVPSLEEELAKYEKREENISESPKRGRPKKQGGETHYI